MARYVTVSVKVPNELRDKMRELGIRVSVVLRRAIEEEVRRREVERVKEAIEGLRPALDMVSVEEAVRGIRRDREREPL